MVFPPELVTEEKVFIPKVRKGINIHSIGYWFISILDSYFLDNDEIVCVCV